MSKQPTPRHGPSTVRHLMAAAGLSQGGVVQWGHPPAEQGPGVYVVALASGPDEVVTRSRAPVSASAVEELLRRRPELRLDGERPEAVELVRRLRDFWLADETVLYVGLASRSIAKRVGQYYATPLGARSPHAGGWFLKSLSVLPKLHVHYATAGNVERAERAMLKAFAAGVSERSRARLHDPERLMPFANLEYPKGVRKRHGITGAKASRASRSSMPGSGSKSPRTSVPPPGAVERRSPGAQGTPYLRSQPVTAKDLERGQVRIPRGASKDVLPPTAQSIELDLRGEHLTCRYNPRYGPPEKSGVIGVGKAKLKGLVRADEVLSLAVDRASITLR
jgi:hypothetical protein